ncbi:MAG: HAD family hydrolase [Eggerthellaceae bacterium]|nr:HAD family hydrolase [Eggerthellaceae bacterium]
MNEIIPPAGAPQASAPVPARPAARSGIVAPPHAGMARAVGTGYDAVDPEAAATACTQAEPGRTYDAIFFDMDGTLVDLDPHTFLERYYRLLDARARRAGINAGVFNQALDAGFLAMGDHPSTITNAAAFWNAFFDAYAAIAGPVLLKDKRMLVDFLQGFYDEEFPTIGKGVVPNPAAQEAVSLLAAKGYPLYLTTMPLFPRAGVLARLAWAQVDGSLFSRITCYDNSTAVKPQLAYYYENLAVAGARPDRVLMVGNNTVDDLACLDTGMDAYLVTDCLINDNGFDVASVKHGTLAQFAAFAQSLPDCPSRAAAAGRPNRSPLDDDPAGVSYAHPGDRSRKPRPQWEDHD